MAPSIKKKRKMQDELANNWGTNLVYTCGGGNKSQRAFECDIANAIPGYYMQSLRESGTAANFEAVQLATDNNPSSCVYALGAYVGGDRFTQSLSTCRYTAGHCLSMPVDYAEADADCKRKTVPFPYYVKHDGMKEEDLKTFEDSLLLFLNKRLALEQLKGTPIRALMLEYILSGCGAELSEDFLKRLGRLLKQFEVQVIVDEILTGGRVGPDIVMTLSMPEEFRSQVSYITMGKFMDAALVLRKNTLPRPEKLRGTSTLIESGKPCQLFNEVLSRIEDGMIQKRSAQVLQTLRVIDNKEQWWGRGCLLFTTHTRWENLRSTKNRCLPMLETRPVRKGSCRKSEWNRTSVSNKIHKCAMNWVSEQTKVFSTGEDMFLFSLVNYLFTCRANEDEIWIRPEEVVRFIGAEKAERMAMDLRLMYLKRGYRCVLKAEALINRVINSAILNNHDTKVIVKRRKMKTRKLITLVKASLVGCKLVLPSHAISMQNEATFQHNPPHFALEAGVI